MPNNVYLDSCVFIDVLQKTNKNRLEACEDLVRKAEDRELIIVTSAWTITEVNRLSDLEKSTKISREKQSELILAFFENEYIVIRQLDRQVAELAHKLTHAHGLFNADAVHVATALTSKVSVLYTYDNPKKKKHALLKHNLKIGVPPLRIEKPPDPSVGTLFSQQNMDDVSGADSDNKEEN